MEQLFAVWFSAILGARGLSDRSSQARSILGGTFSTNCTQNLKLPCEVSGKCYSVDVVKDPTSIYADNLKSTDQIDKKLREKIRQKHLRIREVLQFRSVAGFFTYPLYVLNQLLFAEKYGLIGDKKPFVYMPEKHHYYNPCKSEGSEDFWHRWFQPISDVDYADVPEDEIWEFSQFSIVNIHHDKDGVHTYPYQLNGRRMRTDVGTEKWISCQRSRALPVVMKYFSLKPTILTEADRFWKANMGDAKVIGLHMRGTDKWINRKVLPAQYVEALKKLIRDHPDYKVFLATDDPRFIQAAGDIYNGSVIVRPAVREVQNTFYDHRVDEDVKVLDVLEDMVLLSKSDILVKSWSAVPEFSVYFKMRYNPDATLPVVEMQLNTDSSADANSGCAPETDKGSIHEHLPISVGGHVKKEVSFFANGTDGVCGTKTPRADSLLSLVTMMDAGQCSRSCTAHRTKAMGGNPAKEMQGNKTIVVVASRKKEDISWLGEQPACYIVMEKEADNMEIDSSVLAADGAGEASSYMTFISRMYENVADTTIFTGGDRKSESSLDLVTLLRSINPDAYSYASLDVKPTEKDDTESRCLLLGFNENHLQNREKDSFPGVPLAPVNIPVTTRMIVSQERILARSRVLYADLMEYTISAPTEVDTLLLDKMQKLSSEHIKSCVDADESLVDVDKRHQNLQLSWHVIFGDSWEKTETAEARALCGTSCTKENLSFIYFQSGVKTVNSTNVR
uniref:Uncharacterized protein n=1 Tax=Lotharella oceanica TaxID=641309 RepID=A0A7S2TXC6_9EUKA|mmetsp:Transcript_34166/g.63333  ORF Transcript_34166/g.63333 Transcript_34166/m.63333 type:complete len:733 (+) Transcript_34166:134-2332(+)